MPNSEILPNNLLTMKVWATHSKTTEKYPQHAQEVLLSTKEYHTTFISFEYQNFLFTGKENNDH